MQDIHIEVQEIRQVKGARIVVIGVGGGGSNMVAHLHANNQHQALTLIVANTDYQHLSVSPVPNKIQLGERLTSGLGAGADDEVGKKAALESADEIKQYLSGADMVIVCVGLGGGTGTGAAPVVAQIAKDLGALTVAVATKPFTMEGGRRVKTAQRGFEELNKITDSIIIVPNDKVLSIIGKNTGLRESFRHIDDVLARAARGISSVILEYGAGDINVDFADLTKAMQHKGLALMGIGEGSGENACIDALRNAVESPLFDNLSISGAKGVVLNFEMHPDYPMVQITEALNYISEVADTDDGDIIWGTNTSESNPMDFMRVTVIATGFEKNIITPNQAQQEIKQPAPKPKQDSLIDMGELLRASGDENVDYEQPAITRAKKD